MVIEFVPDARPAHGMPRTIAVMQARSYNRSNRPATLTANAIVSVIGNVQADGSILAKYVEPITTDKAFISGRVLAVNLSSGPATSLTMWVGEERGPSGAIPVHTVQTNGPERRRGGLPRNQLLRPRAHAAVFSNSSLVVGQRIFIGGSLTGGLFTPEMVSRRRQGVVGAWLANSVTVIGNSGSNFGYFQTQNDALMSYSAGEPFYVYTGAGNDLREPRRAVAAGFGRNSKPDRARPGLQERRYGQADRGGGTRSRAARRTVKSGVGNGKPGGESCPVNFWRGMLKSLTTWQEQERIIEL